MSGPRRRLTPSETIRSASISSPESVSSSTAYFGLSIINCRISQRFFSPPEKPSLTKRAVNAEAERFDQFVRGSGWLVDDQYGRPDCWSVLDPEKYSEDSSDAGRRVGALFAADLFR